MTIHERYKVIPIIFILVLLFGVGLTSCKSSDDTATPLVAATAVASELPVQATTAELPAPTPVEANDPVSDPAAVEAAWLSSPHADTFVVDANGQNNTCSRCHAPINWLPAMEDLPESCYACKFELEPPPPTIAEADWADVACKVCHKVDKKDNILPEFAWLEIAPLGEYATVASASELCLKCHASGDVPGHGSIQLEGDHPGYVCTDCHSAHDTKASCLEAGCHDAVVEAATPIAGHDADHQAVTCGACHDGSGMEVGPDEETGLWTTFVSRTTATGDERFAFTSHAIVLASSCERCHFPDNPWGLSISVQAP